MGSCPFGRDRAATTRNATSVFPDIWSELHGPTSWLFSLVIGLAGALPGCLIFTVGLGIGDTDVFDFGGIIGAVIGVVILFPFVGIYARLRRRTSRR